MADSFQQRIGFEGAEDILAKLKAIGLEGTKAFTDVKKAVESVNPSLTALSQTSQAAQKGIAGFSQALGGLTQVLGPVSGGLSNLLGTFAAFGRTGGALAAVGGLLLFTKSAADSVIATENQARAFGLTINQLKALSRAAQQAGVDQEALATALGRFSSRAAAEARDQGKALLDVTKQLAAGLPGASIKIINTEDIKKLQDAIAAAAPRIRQALQEIGSNLGNLPLPIFVQRVADAASKSEQFRDALRKLGVEVPGGNVIEKLDVQSQKLGDSFAALGISLLDVGTKARPTFDVFLDLADKIKNTPDGFQKSAIASKFFGRSVGPELVAALNLGRNGIEDIESELSKLGISFSGEQVAAARQFRQATIDSTNQ